ncbi:putative mitochondrial lipoate-protein ligase-like protein [Leptomonas pyrrhocoris]|uniref:Putative mitochondrial lipoate-protein ligase-like protein n=1 Tax=Leptomonas pyrrhocoris TaxID=157538 RepID=A0A0N0DR73_LEPPY|nr:putative mitochondrial lipoate-protein ligase-like protein [Leptomonas pyrrhocoris]KPA74238.1 putative mitochondrial lipoate-protein ligase-like protein [Leptomonas pyrrhocoris]|eukprot:XP_015652677.1 putative mitochondrial lipoate-protein ligase-like protein [Leptomonas pyrrhocoris]
MWRTQLRRHRVVPTSLSAFLQANSTLQKDASAALHRSTALVVADTNSRSIYENLVAEEALIRALSLDETQCLLLYYVNRPCVVVGRNQNIFQEVALRRTASDGVDVARRASGGGAVFHDEHNLCFSFLTHRSRYAPEKTIQIVRLGLCAMYGVDPARITTTHRHDLFLDGKKITGSAMRVQRDIAYHHCTLLVNTPHALLGRYLHPEGDYADFRTSSVGSVRSPVTTLTESGCVPAVPTAVDAMKADMTAFFLSQGRRVLEAASPWELDIAELRCDFAATRKTYASSPLHALDVCAAVAEDMSFVEGEGRRYARGDAVTFAEAVRKAKSKAWAYAMPTFTSTVLVTQEEFQRCLSGLPAWKDAVRRSSLTAEELLDLLSQSLFTERESVLQLHTTVDHRSITRFEATSAGGEAVSAATAVAVPVEWLSRFFATLLVGSTCDAPVDGVEAAGDASVLVGGFLHEAGAAAPALPDSVRDASVLMVIQTVLSIWRRKNVFDVDRGAGERR